MSAHQQRAAQLPSYKYLAAKGPTNSQTSTSTSTSSYRYRGLEMATTASAATTGTYRVRNCRGEDYDSVIASVDKWWSGRRVSRMLPRLFFEHFCDTSFVVELCTQKHYQSAAAGEDDPILSTSKSPTATKEGQVVGFLCGFVSQARAGEVRTSIVRRQLWGEWLHAQTHPSSICTVQ